MAERTRVKICGCTSLDDIDGAVDAGADAVGIIFAPSPRQISPADARALARAVPPFVALVGVFVNPDATAVRAARELGCVPQFSGDEDPAFCAEAADGRFVKAIHVERTEPDLAARLSEAANRFAGADLLFDSRYGNQYGGTGKTFDWSLVAAIARRRRVIVGGGLTPANVAECVAAVRPFAVDVRSGVETDDRKDRSKMRAFVRAVRESDAQA